MSYNIGDLKWGDSEYGTSGGVITWSADLSGLNYDEDLYDLSDFEDALEAAFQAWEDVADVDFVKVDDPDDADVTVDTASLSGGTVGLAVVGFVEQPGADEIVYAEIYIDSDEVGSPYGEEAGTLDFYAVALHEIGHALGMEHVLDNDEIMFATLGPDELGEGDIEGVRILYGDEEQPDVDFGDPPEGVDNEAGQATASDDGGGGAGGAIGLLLGGLLAALATLFGVGGGAAAAVAFAVRDDDTEEDDPGDLVPATDEAEITVVTHSYGYDGCEGCCGGACGDPDHVAEASTAVL